MAFNRDYGRKTSNNSKNPNKNVCTLAVARYLGVDDRVKFLHCMSDVKRAASFKWSVRSVKSKVKGDTVGAVRRSVGKVPQALFFLVWVDGHVLLLKNNGKTVVDTDPRVRDRRKVLGVYGLFFKKGMAW